MLRVGIVCGEVSGDLLGAGLIKALRQHDPQLIVEGVAGDYLIAEGCKVLYPMDKLSVMGIFEVIGRILELRKIRQKLIEYFIESPPDVFIGVDAPDFNLDIEYQLKAAGIKTVHFVSPSVWAWRSYRLKFIKKAVDLILLLFPFEQSIYAKRQIPYRYVGHPLADTLLANMSKQEACNELGLPAKYPIIAIFPGSRQQELKHLLVPYLKAARLCFQKNPRILFTAAAVNEVAQQKILQAKDKVCKDLPLFVYIRQTKKILSAADVILMAAGTATLEAMLLKKPMVVAYRGSYFNYFIIKPLLKTKYLALPNIIADQRLVPEYIQQHCQPERLADALQYWLVRTDEVSKLKHQFQKIREKLHINSTQLAAEAILDLIKSDFYDAAKDSGCR